MNHKNFLLFFTFIILICFSIHVPGGFYEFYDYKQVPSDHFLEEVAKANTPSPITEHNITLKTDDGITRKAILTLNKKAKGNVVLCHPAARNKEYMKDYADKLFGEYNTIRFDFRRHGEDSENQYSTIGEKESSEVEAAFKVFQDRDDTKLLPTYGFGISMGAAALVQAESRSPMFDGLILQSCYETLKKQIKRMFSFYRIPLMDILIFTRPLSFYTKTMYRIKLRRNNIAKQVKKIRVPIFLIHAHNDTFIPIKAFYALKRAAKTVKKIWTPDDGRHTNILDKFPDVYTKQCADFLESLQKGKSKISS